MAFVNDQIQKKSNVINETILTNMLKMLEYRKWIINDDNSRENLVKNLINKKKEEKIYTIKMKNNLNDIDTYEPNENKNEWKNFDGKNIIIFMFDQKIKGKSNVINEFIAKNINTHKIIIVDSISEKARQLLIQSNKHTEVFTEVEFMLNITEHICCPPIIEILSPQESKDEVAKMLNANNKIVDNTNIDDEMQDILGEMFNDKSFNNINEFLLSYKVKKNELPKQFINDPMSRYLYLKRGQVIRIIRNSESTGFSVYYRIIVNK
jgi:DNA-directed RNA polymerase subunit H (RpoH/RPB5)